MTAAEHLAAAEEYIAAAERMTTDVPDSRMRDTFSFATMHLLAAIAIELGVPPVAAPQGGGQ